MKRITALRLVRSELTRATEEHPQMNSGHEGYAVILEELDELWDEIKANRGSTHRAATEAVQIAAMAIRYLIDLCDEPAAKQHESKVQTHYYSTGSYGGYSG